MQTTIQLTEDGSHTLYVPSINESYHSTHGAIQESKHIFISTGLNYCKLSSIRIFEIGFGTGLNAFLTLLEAEKQKKTIHYTSIELYPVEWEKTAQLNYVNQLAPDRKIDFEHLHNCEWEKDVPITPYFTLKKINANFACYEPIPCFDVCFFDAFSPEKQPELWVSNRFQTLFASTGNKAVLTTYCAKGIVRRAMQDAGFKVERLPGPPGKREILRATKNL